MFFKIGSLEAMGYTQERKSADSAEHKCEIRMWAWKPTMKGNDKLDM